MAARDRPPVNAPRLLLALVGVVLGFVLLFVGFTLIGDASNDAPPASVPVTTAAPTPGSGTASPASAVPTTR